MSRQRDWQKHMRLLGRCVICGAIASPHARCPSCRKKARDRADDKLAATDWGRRLLSKRRGASSAVVPGPGPDASSSTAAGVGPSVKLAATTSEPPPSSP